MTIASLVVIVTVVLFAESVIEPPTPPVVITPVPTTPCAIAGPP
ncbi:hypothetical protein [Sphingopyxis sp.]